MSPRDAGVMVGTMALEDDGRVDFTRLRHDRRQRVLEGMERAGLDALLLGRMADVHYVTGARQLWRAGSIPFAPTCVVVRRTGRVHLLSVWDEGVPPEIAPDDLYSMFWNPANLLAALGAIDGLPEATRVGTDGMTPLFAEALPGVVGGAQLVDAAPVLAGARNTKTAEELTCLTVAAAIAEAALAALEAALAPGVSERTLLGVYDECIAGYGVPTPPSESVAFATPRRGPVRFRHLVSDRPIGDGELVVLAPGALYAGYEAGLARTSVAGHPTPPGARALAGRCWKAMDTLVAACRAGNTGADLLKAWEATGERMAPVPLAHGLGLGVEAPVIGLGLGAAATLEEGSVLSVQSWVTAEGTGGCLERATLAVEAGGPRVITRAARCLP